MNQTLEIQFDKVNKCRQYFLLSVNCIFYIPEVVQNFFMPSSVNLQNTKKNSIVWDKLEVPPLGCVKSACKDPSFA